MSGPCCALCDEGPDSRRLRHRPSRIVRFYRPREQIRTWRPRLPPTRKEIFRRLGRRSAARRVGGAGAGRFAALGHLSYLEGGGGMSRPDGAPRSALLDGAERERWRVSRAAADAMRFACARSALAFDSRRLPQLRAAKDCFSNGTPRQATARGSGIDFNVAHSGRLALIAICAGSRESASILKRFAR